MHVLLHYNAGPRLATVLDEEATGGVTTGWTPEGDHDALIAALPSAGALLHVLEPVTAEMMDRAPRLRLIQKLGVGVDTIDLVAARERGIIVANLPGSNAGAVAELTIGLALSVLRRIPSFDREVRAGTGWPLPAEVPDRLGEIAGRTVGLVGYGTIARRVGMIATAMGATVIHCRRTDDGRPGWRSLDALLAEADVVSVHLPFTADTAGLIDARRLALMKHDAILVDTGRGGVVDQAALAHLLRTGRVAGAGIDVFEDEPLSRASPLVGLDNVVLTPHVAWLSGDTLARCVRLGVANARRVVAGEPVESVVEPPSSRSEEN